MSGRIRVVIYFFTGENSFEIEREIERLITEFRGEVEKKDAEDVTIADLRDILQGQTLFNDTRLVIITQLSDNKPVWDVLPDRLPDMSSDVTLILIEPKPDKRTKTYKAIVKLADVKEFSLWTYKDQHEATIWIETEAKRQGFALTSSQARHLLQRVGFDQWSLQHALEKLHLLDDITNDRINDVIEAQPDENIFQLLDTALRGDIAEVHRSLQELKQTADAYQLFALLSSQLLQLVSLALADKPAPEVAKDIGAHPFVLSKLSSHAARIGLRESRQFIMMTAETDMQMKSSGLDPWLLIEQLLIKIARR